MAIINQPTNDPVDQQSDTGAIVGVNRGWRNFFNAVFNICNALSMSGTTARRPTEGLWIGRTYFDTSLGAHGKPIWVASVAAGVATWVDATSAIV